MPSFPATHPKRDAPLEIDPTTFRALGHDLVDRIAAFLDELPSRPVAPASTPTEIRAALGGGPLPETGGDPQALVAEAAELLVAHSVFNGHPRFWGYITSSAAPIGALGDLLAAAVNANVGGFALAPMATEMELQAVGWIADLVGYPAPNAGLLVSGGNMANFVGVVAARRAKAGPAVRETGMATESARRLRLYASTETHTWLEKAADLFGFGTDAVRRLPTDAAQRLETAALRSAIAADIAAGDRPFFVVGNAGTVATGAVDPLPEIADICREHGLWFHVDGAYGACAAGITGAPPELRSLALADSLAVDPHKWLYVPVEAGCALVRDRRVLLDAFSYHPSYYHFGDDPDAPPNFYELGPQNSRAFRALKVWLAIRQAGRAGYARMIGDDIALARELYERVATTPDLEARSHSLSIVTFRYVPAGADPGDPATTARLNRLNDALLTRLNASGDAFLSKAVVDGQTLLRACIVNFRTTAADIAALPPLVCRIGAQVEEEMRRGG